MKFRIVLLFSLIFVSSVFSNEIYWEIEHNVDEISFKTYENYDVITINNGQNIMIPGQPALQSMGIQLSIPPTSRIFTVKVVNQEWLTLGYYKILPTQHKVPFGFEPVINFEDEDVYSKDNYFPENPILKFNTGNKSGFIIAGLAYCPFRYNPVTEELQLLIKGTIVITYFEGLEISLYITEEQRNVFAADVENLVSNAYDVNKNSPMISITEDSNIEYVVIAPEYLCNSFIPLINWKNLKGIRSEIISKEWILSNYSGYDDMEKIREFVKDYHQNKGLIYLVLAGDYDNLGARLIHSEVAFFNISDDLPSDLYFSDIVPYSKNWDANGNHIYGEFQRDSCDWYSDVYVGRFPVNTTLEAEIWINKLLCYEQNPPLDYIETSLMGGAGLWPDSNLFGDIICDSIADNYLPANWIDTKLYETHSGHPDGFVDSLDKGFHWIHVAAHGNKDGVYWDAYPSQMLTSYMADYLSNGMKLFIFHSIACMSGWFDDYDCLAEHIFNAPNGGAIAIMLNARYGIGDGILPDFSGYEGDGIGPSGWLDIWTVDELFQGGNWNIGRGHGLGKDNCIPIMDSSYHWCTTELNLFGDPETQIYSQEPGQMTVSHPSSIAIGSGLLHIDVQSSGLPLQDAVCCLSIPEDTAVWFKAVTDASGLADIAYSIYNMENLSLTVYAHDHIYYCDTLTVLSSGPFVTFACIDSLYGGYNNGQINSGCTYSADIALVNLGNDSAINVYGFLTSTDPAVNIDPDTINFGDFGSNDTLISQLPFQFTFSQGIGDSIFIDFDITAWDVNDSSWSSNFSLMTNSPVIQLYSVGGPELVEPGDSFSISPRIKNEGSGSGYNLELTLRTDDPYATIIDSLHFADSISPGALNWFSNAFQVYISTNIPEPYFMDFELITLTSGGYLFYDTICIGINSVIFSDNFENGDSNWIYTGPTSWHLTEHNSYSSSNSMYCGQEGTWQYAAPVFNSYVMTDTLVITEGSIMTFWHWYDISDNSDKVQVVYSTDGGTNWGLLYPDEGYTGVWNYTPYDSIYTGEHKIWEEQHVSININENAQIGWLFFSNPTGVAEGYYFDDVEIILNSGLVGVEAEDEVSLISSTLFNLMPAYPNPVRGRAMISYSVGSEVSVRLVIYDLTGREVSTLVNQVQNAGNYRIEWNGRDSYGHQVSSGTYFYRMTAGTFTASEKLIVVR